MHKYLTRFLLVKKTKRFIGYLFHDYKVKPLRIMLLKTSTYVKTYVSQTKWIYFLIGDDDLLNKYNTISNKVSADIKKNLITNLSVIKSF